MSAASHLPTLVGTASAGALIAGLTSLPRVRALLAAYLGHGALRKMLTIAACAYALANLKNLPGLWHIRVLRGIIYQVYFQPTKQQPRHLFAPMITSSRNTLYDCDYNLHKSNSTYFADLDVSRAHHVGCIVRMGLARLNRGDERGLSSETIAAPGQYFVALGAVSCFFQRQIEPLQAFEIYTRVLSWDRKWLYLVSHIVKKGAIKPDSYALQPWKKSKRTPGQLKDDDKDLTKHIFATSVSRYVFKKGRLTISPEVVLERSRLLPERPAGAGPLPRGEAIDGQSSEQSSTVAINGAATGAGVRTELSSSELEPSIDAGVGDSDWAWEDMEKERLRGLKLASHFDAMGSMVHGELRAGEALGQYGDYW